MRGSTSPPPSIGRDREDRCTAGLHLLDVRDDLVEQTAARGDGHDQRAFLDQRDRTVLQLTRRVRLGADVAEFLELEGALLGHGATHLSPEEEDVAHVLVLLRDRLDVVSLQRRLGDLVGHQLQVADEVRRFFRIEGAAGLRELQRQQVERGNLGDVGLGRRHADLRPGVGVDHGVGVAGHRRVDDVAHGEHPRLLPFGKRDGFHRVERLAGLADGDNQARRGEHRVAVTELTGDIDLDGQLGPVLDRKLADHSGVEAGAAPDDEHLVDPAEVVIGERASVPARPRRCRCGRATCRARRRAARGSP